MVRLLEKKQRTVNLLTTFAIATLGLQILALLFLTFQGLKIRQLSLRKPAAFVQLIAGQPITVNDDLVRDPEAIRQFVSKSMTSMFNWSGKLPAQNVEEVSKPKSDLGILIPTSQGISKKVTTSSWIASFAISEDFRKGFLREIAAMTPPEVFSNNSSQAITAQIAIKRVYPPQKISPGKWRVGLVADLIQTKKSDGRRIITPFNKDVLVQAVDYFPYPLDDTTSVLQKAIYGIRSEKLEIYEIRNLCLLDQYNNLSQEQLQQCGIQNTSDSFVR
ncbi:hypothetical protein NIES592_01200 [Fischerella major NIES-592]|uniref:Uncharacterized protein n=2 Tax=Fischerella TaxID=1190 RepID=A0A1U7H4V2_9CYAN|nr:MULTISPECIES: hypothetical protein [Fischerella]OKH16291.1 hypothetical protein NIES592_01200 [Fischerella major NIES-592]PMB45719.1 hypothetical protein CEN41_07520 [Fischerella thermalis CCMEE 5330]BCX10739.1 MAG: hypothetical protein KatS3mg066_4598 [Fischerella sp.]